eukprot:gnl/TRDRNA2_/TRDRNA2_177687_c0_seq11.p1 gnl/TRDRNA2_/TRDRNA2_177687_c0~~gnl/TRDRNA2_/TRDRNA2_177687_c0_seq11.p1  ORF type:complete len:188 (-),score=42.34 gnl/TRDRNA2_/TRDRNA2_177687_c0_seq11:279-842(-)
MSTPTLALAETMLEKEDSRNGGRGSFRLLMCIASLLGCATLFYTMSQVISSDEGEPVALWTAATARAPGFMAPASPSAQLPRIAFRGMNVPQAVHPRSFGWGAAPTVVRADVDLEKSISKMISEQLSVDADKITPGSSFVDLGADSLDTVELLMALEEEFGVEIPEEEAQKLTTVQAVIDYAKAQGK